MTPLVNVTAGIHVASTIVVLLYTFFSFLAHYAQANSSFNTVSRNFLRLTAVAVLLSTLVAEAVLLNRKAPTPAALTEHMLSIVYTSVAWALVCLRKRLLVVDLFSLSLVIIVLGSPLAVTEYLAKTADHIFMLHAVRLVIALSLLVDSARRLRKRSKTDATLDDESQPLLQDDSSTRSANSSFGSHTLAADSPLNNQSDKDSDTSSVASDESEDDFDSAAGRLRKSGSWIEYLRNFKVFLPSLIPRDDVKVQACLALCILNVLAGRALIIAVPQQLGKVTDELVSGGLPIKALLVYYLLTLLDGECGRGLVETLTKMPVQQYSYRKLSNAAFAHVMRLEMSFHDDQDSAELMKAVEQGEALTNILDTAVLEMLPTVLDTVAAFVVLYAKFNAGVAVALVTAGVGFFAAEVVTAGYNIDNRRRVTRAERRQTRVMHQAVQGWRTVSAFNMLSYETRRYGEAVGATNRARLVWAVRDAYIEAVLSAVMPTTFFGLALVLAREIHAGRASPGDFVFLLQYWELLLWPLKFLSREYRYLMRDLVDAERLLALLSTEPAITDAPDAKPLGPGVRGAVAFEHVDFAYDPRRPALRDANISAAPGQTVALVGATGAGKSTITKLLMRYYDVTGGRVTVDGTDIRSVTQGSLRDVIGLVPQDPLLFNATIMENVRYARPSATDAEVHEACRAAAIHDHIVSSFPDGYATRVGESGTRMSGGELQRIAIARVFLKDPPILVLDEATSAVDTNTEALIQLGLARVSERRTTFVVAHRLSTVVRADKILVLHAGAIVERGTHAELLRLKGRYYSLWENQRGGLLDLEGSETSAEGESSTKQGEQSK
ncbi:abc transporter [Cordyceps fumosorosea ARSEF 2679]|uniref:Abc transporter n=1 Tax=Cordyceps fumosorosea (strain ARSEF 2679) TaxID=1081104 RepID=A0A168D9V9_CORFA|nr:abc transporter [Cordyceps fumosorosea ARSEF 2679]OAA72340.1 abc transporter [Cordyceps fumosorosea ARSEF 2679]